MADISMKCPDSRDNSKMLLEIGFFNEIMGLPEAEEEKWDEEDCLILIPHGTTLKDYVQCDDGLATEDTLSDDWESLMTEGARSSSETCQDEESDCDSDVKI
ncbi:hypothetical protein CHS0354_002825 [Potamilus streckersoni]|uniref:Uncharacterized protein n=1 Tax=Potamilus streckersoni TaxID=2493646 RepID=A0AAE0RMF5_9BIVA|nr:hypothetical protein CHS0354_002825 [Potamilus streckersoni]